MHNKTCTKCGQGKNIVDFHKDRSKKDGYRNVCIACRSTTKLLKEDPIIKAKRQKKSPRKTNNLPTYRAPAKDKYQRARERAAEWI